MDGQHDREARAQALSLLKKKLKTSGRRRRQDTCDSLGVNDCDDEKPIDGEVRAPEETKLDSQQPSDRDYSRLHAATAAFCEPSNPEATVGQMPQPIEASKPPYPPKVLKKLVVKWSCTRCNRECIPIREESRCLCGHRYKEHPSSKDDARVVTNKALASGFMPFACTSGKCSCKAFFYVVAEGAWILRCRCKHKHTDHDPGSKPFKCHKAKCPCDGFDSPWVCNCDHRWTDHVQETIEKEFKPLELFQEQFQIEELNRVARTDLLAGPMRL